MNDDGTINIETLQSSIAVNENIVYSAQNETFKRDDTGITLTDANNPNDKTKINSKGIFISTDGGTTWKNAVRGEGISTQYLTAGNINVGSIVILDGQFTTFRWDSKGISAYVPIEGGGINLGKFVRFDHYGIYGVNGESNFSPNSEQEIYDKASFGMTWNRFFMKNNKGTGSIEISTDKDIQIKAEENERIKIGRLDENGQQYGIRISDDSGKSVMETGDEGKLWLKNQLNISKSKNDYNIQLGFLDKTKENNIHEVFNATDKFIVYEDGSMKATDGEFTGTINATGGKIGNMTIGTVESAITNMDSIAEATRKLDISSKLGYNFKVEGGVSSPVALELVATPTAFTIDTSGISWFGSNNFESWIELDNNTNTYSLAYEDFKEKQLNSTYYIKAVATSIDGNSYEDWTTIMSISDGKKGEDALSLVIFSTKGNYFKNNQGSTTLIAKLFKGGQEIDAYEPYEYTYIWRDANDPNWSSPGKTLTVTADDVSFSRTYICDISKGGI